MLKGNEMRETKIKIPLCKTKKNPETDGYERDNHMDILDNINRTCNGDCRLQN